MDWDIQRLRILYELQQKGTMAAVAESLNYSASAVSQQLSALTSEVGAPLLEREGRRVRLTPQAEILANYAARVFEILDEARSEIAASRSQVVGTIRLASLQTVILAPLPHALTWVRENHPLLRVETTQAEPQESIRGLLSREYDVAIVETYGSEAPPRRLGYPDGVEQWLLFADTMRVAVPRELWVERPEKLADLRAVPWVMELPDSPTRIWAEQVFRRAGFEPDVLFESNDMTTHIQLVETGHAVALVPDLLWSLQQPKVPLVRLPEVTERKLSMCMRRGFRKHPTVQVLYEALRAAISDARRAQAFNLGAGSSG